MGDKEGLISRKVADLDEFWKGQKKIEILDPNLLACKEHRIELLDQLIDSKAEVNFNQGLDVRFADSEIAEKLNKIKVKLIHFAWDNYEFKTYEKLSEMRKSLKYDRNKVVVYILTNFDTTQDQDLERIYKVRDLGFDPYVMIYDKPNAPKITKNMQRWCNAHIIRVCERFEDYVG